MYLLPATGALVVFKAFDIAEFVDVRTRKHVLALYPPKLPPGRCQPLKTETTYLDRECVSCFL